MLTALKPKHSSKAAISPSNQSAFAFDGLYYSTEHNLALLTGEGVQSATEKLAALCGAKHNKIQEIINLGVAGIVENSPKFKLGEVKEIRTSYLSLGHKMEFKSFSTFSYESSPFHVCDIVTSSKRALKTSDCQKLLPFAPLVDRETWAIGSVANRFQVPFRSLKVLSDKVYEADQEDSLEVCRLVKDQAPLWSQQLLDAFYKISPLEKDAALNNLNPKKEVLRKKSFIFS